MSRILKPITFTILAVICSAFCTNSYAQSRDPYAPERAKMVEEYISSEGVQDPRVLEAMGTVPRHLFVRPNFRYLAYTDQALDIGFKQTISPPFIVAYMTEMLATQPTDKVLEIGTGSGYQAAVLSGLVQDVYTIEIVEPLGQRTEKLLKRLKYDNVHTKIGDGYQGWPEHAPFDKIIVTCSPESVPAPLVEQLKEGGRMIVPLGERYQQVFYLFEKENGQLKQTKLLPTLFVPMTGQMEELRKVKPDPLNPTIVNGGFEEDENGDGLADHWHYVRRGELSDESSAGRKSIRFENSESGRMSHMLQGMAIDGSQISEARVSWAMKSENIRSGRAAQQQPGIAFYFYDSRRLPIGRVAIGPWLADQEEWKRSSTVIKIPRTAKEAIIQAGLNGSTGILYLDEIQITPIR
ncbi:protein-L-isoaspartate(D-aspartate) O-methyltransferase [Thalassoglobus sp.]|uniref:protein-L-isoaspartate(D-aspartate) O-methyltransferase n=1 Tax=Thalassoglobus sp. TaxID=2795869 RepID=UPI003AA806B8